LPSLTLILFASLVVGNLEFRQAPDVASIVKAAAACRETARPSGSTLDCKFEPADGPQFAINDVGGASATFAVSRASERDRYYVMLSFLHRCIVVGDRRASLDQLPFAFVSLANGKVYRTWQECGATYGKSP